MILKFYLYENSGASTAARMPVHADNLGFRWGAETDRGSWELSSDYHRQAVFPSRARPAEIAAHLRDALKFMSEHSEICETRALVIYAWNEYDEGGWLAPTRSADGHADTSRLDAVREVLSKRR